jgi:hypothetical protein
MEQFKEAFPENIQVIDMTNGVNNLVVNMVVKLPMEQELAMQSLDVVVMMKVHGIGVIRGMGTGMTNLWINMLLTICS